MPLPKMPAKPAVILSPSEYPQAEKGKPVKPSITLIEAPPRSTELAPVARAKTEAPAPAAKAAKPLKAVDTRPKSGTSRAADRVGKTKLFVLDTNVLMHDPTSLFRFAEHDVYLPMITLEELDNHKKGMSEVARNARQVSRSLDALVSDIDDKEIDVGIPLSKLGNKDAGGRLFFQTSLQVGELPEGLPEGKADNQILAVVRSLQQQHPERAVVLVSKDINMRIKARAMALPAEKEGSSRVVTQFFGHIVRGENISLVDGGHQKRAFTHIDDGIDALMKIIANEGGVASGKIYNIGNPGNNYSIRELAHMMLELAKDYPEYADTAKRVQLVETTSSAYYGKGYQDVQNRVPKITNTCDELKWSPTTGMEDTLRKIFDAYRSQVAEARALMD